MSKTLQMIYYLIHQ